MAPSNPKRPPRPPRPPGASASKKEDVELPFDDDEVAPLQEDDPRPQRVPQLPAGPRRTGPRQQGARADTQDRELATRFDTNEYSDPGHVPAFLYVEKGPGTGQLIPVKQGPLVIGRASVCDLRLQHPSISRRHAQLMRQSERFVLLDLGSQNGTFVNRVKVSGEREIHAGDEISLGNAVLKLRGPGALLEKADEPAVPAYPPARMGRSLTRVALVAAAVGSAVAALLTLGFLKFTDPEDAYVPPPPAQARESSSRPSAKGSKSASPAVKVDRASVIALYAKGDVDGALSLARSGQLGPLATKLAEYQSAQAAGQQALDDRDTGRAIQHLSAALAVDEELSLGWAAQAPKLRKQLGRLYTQRGQEQVRAGAQDAARESFELALKYDPSNTWASSELQALGTSQ